MKIIHVIITSKSSDKRSLTFDIDKPDDQFKRCGRLAELVCRLRYGSQCKTVNESES